MQVEIEDNPNTRGSEQFVFAEIGAPRAIRSIVAEERGQEVVYDVAAVEPGAKFGFAMAVKITDSGEGYAFLIYGGKWGIRLRRADTEEPWDLGNPRQWGEPFKIYGSEGDLVYQ